MHNVQEMSGRQSEITDLLLVPNGAGGAVPARRDDVVAQMRAGGQPRAARVVSRLPIDSSGVLVGVDELFVRVHCELQRLSEELQMPRRLTETIRAWAEPLLQTPGPVRVVDVGCGIGFSIRWMAAHKVLDPRVELVGCDLNPVLVANARQLASTERLPCEFIVGDALDMSAGIVTTPARTLLISSGVLHHFDEATLQTFFRRHADLEVNAFCHFDISPGPWAVLGAWLFHAARMREPVSRHDGVLSARRAFPAPVLLGAARAGAPGYDVTCIDNSRWRPAMSDVLRPLTGRRR